MIDVTDFHNMHYWTNLKFASSHIAPSFSVLHVHLIQEKHKFSAEVLFGRSAFIKYNTYNTKQGKKCFTTKWGGGGRGGEGGGGLKRTLI